MKQLPNDFNIFESTWFTVTNTRMKVTSHHDSHFHLFVTYTNNTAPLQCRVTTRYSTCVTTNTCDKIMFQFLIIWHTYLYIFSLHNPVELRVALYQPKYLAAIMFLMNKYLTLIHWFLHIHNTKGSITSSNTLQRLLFCWHIFSPTDLLLLLLSCISFLLWTY